MSCGHGLKMRGVECKSADGNLSAKCDPLSKPPSVLQCTTGIVCDGASTGGGTIIVGKSGSPLKVSNELRVPESRPYFCFVHRF